jgi:ABC-type multidrug transport system ATPase subunit
VRETLTFGALFHLPQEMTMEEKQQRVEDLLETMHLNKVASSLVGSGEETRGITQESDRVRGLSGGERRRVAIALEIIHLPKLIFLDEPTNGLDSVNASSVINILRVLANQNRTILCTIHQPSVKCFNSFDKVLLLSKGKMAYFGEVSDLHNYFSTCMYEFPFQNHVTGGNGRSIADYVLDIVSGTVTCGEKSVHKTTDGEANVVSTEAIIDLYYHSPEYQKLGEQIAFSLSSEKKAHPVNWDEPVRVQEEAESQISVAIQSYFFPEQHDTFALSTSAQIQLLLYMFYLKRKLQMDLTIVTIVK